MKNYYKDCIEIGLDEVARGCLLGRVYTAGVIWNNDYIDEEIIKIVDSKKLSKKKREEAHDYILDNCIDYNISFSDEKEIDKKNILSTTLDCFHKCLNKIEVDIEHILVDGIHFNNYKNIPYKCIPKGDNKYYSIAAASILAKVTHDKYIVDLCQQYPDLDIKYDLLNNMGYGTKKHMEGIKKYGISQFHRKTFKPCY